MVPGLLLRNIHTLKIQGFYRLCRDCEELLCRPWDDECAPLGLILVELAHECWLCSCFPQFILHVHAQEVLPELKLHESVDALLERSGLALLDEV